MSRVERLARGARALPWFLRTEDEEVLAEMSEEQIAQAEEAEEEEAKDVHGKGGAAGR